jgi:hypothetical protein
MPDGAHRRPVITRDLRRVCRGAALGAGAPAGGGQQHNRPHGRPGGHKPAAGRLVQPPVEGGGHVLDGPHPCSGAAQPGKQPRASSPPTRVAWRTRRRPPPCAASPANRGLRRPEGPAGRGARARPTLRLRGGTFQSEGFAESLAARAAAVARCVARRVAPAQPARVRLVWTQGTSSARPSPQRA